MMEQNHVRRTVETDERAAGSDVRERECPECGSTELQHDSQHGEVVCRGCDLVVDDEQVDPGPEWRAFTHDERQQKSRVGGPVTETLHDKGLTTQIDWRDKDAYNRPLSADKRRQMRRLRKWQERIRTSDAGERNLRFALSEIDRMGSALGVPRSVREVASVVYRRALDDGLVRGRSIEGVATAALYAACRQEGIPRSLDEVTDVARVGRTEIARTYRYLDAELGLNQEPVDPKQYVPRFCSLLDLSEAVEQRATTIIDAAMERGLHSGKSPNGYAGAAIYLAARDCEQKRTQQEIADVAGVTKVTVRNHCHEQRDVVSSADG